MRVAFDQAGGFVAGAFHQAVVEQGSGPETGKALLRRAVNLARAAEFKVNFGEQEAVVVGFHCLKASQGFFRLTVRKKKTIRLVLTASHAAAELVKLGQTEPVRSLNHHNGGVGDVHPDFDHRRRNQDFRFLLQKVAHDLLFFFRFHTSVQKADRNFGEDRFIELLEFLFGRFYPEFIGNIDQWTDNENLPPFPDLFFYKIIGVLPFFFRYHPRPYFFSSFRHLPDDGEIEIAVESQGQGAGDRRGGHGQKMRHLKFSIFDLRFSICVSRFFD